MKDGFRFVNKITKKCSVCGRESLMFRVQKVCDECRKARKKYANPKSFCNLYDGDCYQLLDGEGS